MSRTVRLLASIAAAMLFAGSIVVFLHAAVEPSAAQAARKPNIVFIYSDDQDVGTMRFMPNVKEELAAKGITFKNAFATTPVCCPTRTTFLRGQYSHNTHVTTNKPPLGGYKRFVLEGYRDDHLGVWMHNAGYATGHFGKLMNFYNPDTDGPPKGFDDFFARPEVNHTDLVRKYALDFVRERAPRAQPFYLSVSPSEPHAPYWFPPRYADLYKDAQRPRTPNFNEKDVSDKPAWVRNRPRLTPRQVAKYDEIYRKRLRGVKAVDALVGTLVKELRRQGELSNTYFIYSSDNGFMLGAHRLLGKGEPYEESIRVPLVVSGPGLTQGVTRTQIAATNDVAPTIMDLAGLDPKPFFDGRSIKPLLDRDPKTGKTWRSAVGIEWLGPQRDPRRYYGVRTASGEKYVYHTRTGEEEYYNLRNDPYELVNKAHDPTKVERVSQLKARAQELSKCRADGCWAAER